MGGFSFGSEVAMWVAMNSNLVQVLSIASTLFEPAGYWLGAVRGSDRPDVMRRVWGLGRPEETPEVWRRLSPALSSERMRVPLLLQMPEQEAPSFSLTSTYIPRSTDENVSNVLTGFVAVDADAGSEAGRKADG